MWRVPSSSWLMESLLTEVKVESAPHNHRCPLCACALVFESSLHYVAYYMFKAQFNSKWKCSAFRVSRLGMARQALQKMRERTCNKCSGAKGALRVTCVWCRVFGHHQTSPAFYWTSSNLGFASYAPLSSILVFWQVAFSGVATFSKMWFYVMVWN